MAGEPTTELRLIGGRDLRRIEPGRRRWRIERYLCAHDVVIHRPDRGGRLELLFRGHAVTARGQDFSTPVQRFGPDARLRVAGEEGVPRRQSTARVAEHEVRQSTSEGAGHARITRRIACHETVVNSGGAGVVAQLLLRLASFEQSHWREVVVGNVFRQLEQLRGGVLGGRRQAAVVACLYRLVTVRERVQIRIEIGTGAAEIPEEIANHARVEAVLGAHAAELLQQEHGVGRLARARELRNRGAQRVDGVIRAAELARAHRQVVELLAEEALGARRR